MRQLVVWWLLTQLVLVFSAQSPKSRYGIDSSARLAPHTVKPLLSRLGRMVSKVESSSFIKSKVDGSTYKFMRLQNQMATFLVSNKIFSSSVVALSVGVGMVTDPEELPGLASLVQETLCLGTHRLFESSGFCSFISSVNGTLEMVANERNSVFVIEVGNEHISTVLDRFSDMIRNPSFPEKMFFSKTAELSGTFESLLKDQEFLFQCVFRDISLEDHVFRRLNVLTDISINEAKETSEINLLQHVKNFHRQQYSSNIMTLVVASASPLARLSNEVISNFSLVKNLNISRPLPLDLARVIRHPHLGAVGNAIHVNATQSKNELVLEFPVDYQEVLWDSSPGSYLEYLLRDNSRTSLSHFLTSRGWILRMEAGVVSHKYSFSSFEVRFLLTSKGFERIKSIIQATLVVLEHIKASPVKQDILAEIKQVLKYRFDYRFEVSPRRIAEKIIDSFDVKGCSPEEVLIAGSLVRSSNPEEVSVFLDKISIDNMLIFVKHSDFSAASRDGILGGDDGILRELGIEIPGIGAASRVGDDGYSGNGSVELRRCPRFGNEYLVEELSGEFFGQINAAIDLVHTKSLGFKIRKRNKLLGSTPLQYLSGSANYRLYSPTWLKSAILDYLAGESSASSEKTLHNKIRENVDQPVYDSFLFFNNVNFQAPFATFFLRVEMPGAAVQSSPERDSLDIPVAHLDKIKSVRELVLSLEVLVACLSYSAQGIIKNMQAVDGLFSVKSILKSELGGVPFGFEIKVRGFLGPIFLALKYFSRMMLHLGRSISQERFEQIVRSVESKAKTENANRSPAEASELALRSIFEKQKTSTLHLETDYSSISLEQITELSLFLRKSGVHKGAVIGNVNPLQAYTILNQFISGVRHLDTKDISVSTQDWKILDPLFSRDTGLSFYHLNRLSAGNAGGSSNSLLYVPFSYFGVESVAFRVMFGHLVLALQEKLPLHGVEINIFPKINEIFLVALSLSLSGPENIITQSEKLLDTFNSLVKLIKGVQKSQFDQMKKNLLMDHNIESHFGRLELRILYQVTYGKNFLAILQGIKPFLEGMDYLYFTKACDLVFSSPKFLVATQKAVDVSSDLGEIVSYVPPGFSRVTDLGQLTDSDTCAFIHLPFHLTGTE